MRFELRRELGLLAAAFQLLTRLPVPSTTPWQPDTLPRAAKFFPLVGVVIGAVAAGALLVGAALWPEPIPAILAVATAVLLTGALHEDGLADTADSFGGRTPEARLAIMKDSRLGTFGALALLLTLALRIAALGALPASVAAAALIAVGAAGRAACVGTMAAWPYAGDSTTAKVARGADRPRAGELALAGLLGLAPFLLLPAGPALVALACGAALAALTVWRMGRLLGGYTGDVLGASEVLFEIGALLGLVAALGRAS